MKRIIENVVKVLIILLVISWIVIIFIDFFRTRAGKDPVYCISEDVIKHEDGETYKCVGLGYKMYRYNRTCSGVQFGPFFIKELTSQEICELSGNSF